MRRTCRFCQRPIARRSASGLWWAIDDVPVLAVPQCEHEPEELAIEAPRPGLADLKALAAEHGYDLTRRDD